MRTNMMVSKVISKFLISCLEIIACFLISAAVDAWAADVTLAWDPNVEPDLAGYRIYYGTVSGGYSVQIDVKKATKYTLTGLMAGKTYYFVTTAYDTSGYESGYSNQLSYSVPNADVIPAAPAKPLGASTAPANKAVTFSTSSSDPDSVDLQYRFDWGEGVLSVWGSASQSCSWSKAGQYAVKVQARNSLKVQSNWSDANIVTIVSSLPKATDWDGDGLPNSWEYVHNLNGLLNDALEDADKDGFSNLREFLSGSDPQDDNDKPSVLADYGNDDDVDGVDLSLFIQEFGKVDCDTSSKPCEFDLDTDGDVDVIDLWLFSEDYGRS
jgi:hypothetical protein